MPQYRLRITWATHGQPHSNIWAKHPYTEKSGTDNTPCSKETPYDTSAYRWFLHLITKTRETAKAGYLMTSKTSSFCFLICLDVGFIAQWWKIFVIQNTSHLKRPTRTADMKNLMFVMLPPSLQLETHSLYNTPYIPLMQDAPTHARQRLTERFLIEKGWRRNAWKGGGRMNHEPVRERDRTAAGEAVTCGGR